MTVGLHQPGDTVLHRLPAGAKLAGLSVISIGTVVAHAPAVTVSVFVLAVLLACLGRVPLVSLVRSLRLVLAIAVVAAALQWWWYDLPKAVETLVDLVSLALLAVVVTVTTAVTAMLDTIVRLLGPLRRVGLDTERVALAVALAIRALPATVDLGRETRDAARARGLGRDPRAHLTPFVIRVVAQAHLTGDALVARGIGDDDLVGPADAAPGPQPPP
ncbi:energy-coupling factor transporter transmembrane protein EcfT [Nocardioides dongxiaopingii]|uniref:energy-coupling factor transporter transmembrane component T family protein n=1 Tax=Nocardioides TaxID=1839 RepID=UPI0010C76847|nr:MULTISPECIES: energy-coupling factor transporter transmembrane protein EcfT [Nocardioides]QCW51564.1 energy-coupling factor transporter transmembrane protein EcfT [Nocardioides sp. S-1144]